MPMGIKMGRKICGYSKKYIDKGIGIIAFNSNVSRFDGDDSLDKMAIHAREKTIILHMQDPEAKLAYAFGATKTPHVYF